MGFEPVNFAYLSELIGAPVMSAQTNKRLGRVIDLAAVGSQVFPKVSGVLIKPARNGTPAYLPWAAFRRSDFTVRFIADRDPSTLGSDKGIDGEILLRRSFLDKQLISTTGYKLVRVNDLQLLIDNSPKENANLFLVHIDIGFKGLLRRLGWLRPINAVFRWIVSRDMKDRFLSWKHIQPTTTTTVLGSLRLTTDASKLSEIHPADLADILEDLGTDERKSLLESMEPSIAASTMQEMPLNIRVQVAETLETENLARIIQAMQRDESVDLIGELAVDVRSALFNALPTEIVAELKELINLSTFGVGSIMNTEFVTVPKGLRAGDVLDRIRSEAGRVELIYYVYVTDADEHLIGIVSLRSILASPPDTPLDDLMRENYVAVSVDDRIKDVAQIFLKYNFEAVPVIDEQKHILGIVSLRDTLESVFPKLREDSKA